MVEVKFEVVKPNLYVVGDEVYFGIDGSDVIQVSRSVDEVIKKYIGELKVTKNNLKAIELGKGERGEKIYVVPLEEYLIAYEKLMRVRSIPGLANDSAELLGLSYVVWASTVEDLTGISSWLCLKEELKDPNEMFDREEEKNLVFKFDRTKTLELMRNLYQELDPKIPENLVKFFMTMGVLSGIDKDVGIVSFEQLKSKDKTKIEKAKSQLVEILRDVDGPCLSFDVPQILRQALSLYPNAGELVQKYGDVLLNPNWRKRLFRLDP